MSIFMIRLWIQFIVFLVIISLSSCSNDNEVSYSTYCNTSVIPQSTTTREISRLFFPVYPRPSSHVFGGVPFLNPNLSKVVLFGESKAYETSINGVVKVEVSLFLREKLEIDYYYPHRNYTSDSAYQRRELLHRSRKGLLEFSLKGYLNEDTGDICIGGFGSGYTRNDELIYDIPAVFKGTYFCKNSSIVTSLITATLYSLSSGNDSRFFQKISMLMFFEMSYEYSLVLNEIANGGFEDVSKSLPLLSGQDNTFCSIFRSLRAYEFELIYPRTCDSAKACTPFGSYFPTELMLYMVQCDDEDRKMRLMLKFTKKSYYQNDYYTSFDPKNALIGEGIWDGMKNQLQIVACKVLGFTGSSKDPQVGDCSIRVALRFPATGSIIDFSYIRGKIWSVKSANDLEYFDAIVFKTTKYHHGSVEALEYEYTQTDRVRNLCATAAIANKSINDRYPDVASDNLFFGISAKTPDGNSSFGLAVPLYVNDRNYEEDLSKTFAMVPSSDVTPMENTSTVQATVNISYIISFSKPSNVRLSLQEMNYMLNRRMETEISAEGIYDPMTGRLCMIGCKKVRTDGRPTIEKDLDCKILIKVEFLSVHTRSSGRDYIKGRIESTRKTNDSLYFEPLDLT